jgi:hypothetical protein
MYIYLYVHYLAVLPVAQAIQTNWIGVMVTLLTHILEVLSLNIGGDISCPNFSGLRLFLLPPDKCGDNTLISSLSLLSKFIHSVLYSLLIGNIIE